MKDVDKLWDKFNQQEIFEESFTENLRICMNLEDIVNDNHIKKQVKLEKDLLNVLFILYYYTIDVNFEY